jgi:O-antigen/teichoic acid export membrane protein
VINLPFNLLSRLSVPTLLLLILNGISGLVIANGLGPKPRGELGVMIGIYALSVMLIDQGNLNSTTYFAAKNAAQKQLLGIVHQRMISNSCVVLPFLMCIPFLFHHSIGFLDTSLIFVIAFLNSYFAGPVHLIQSIDLMEWKNLFLIQIPILVFWIILFQFIYIDLYLAFICVTATPLSSALMARQRLKFVEATTQFDETINSRARVTKYANQSFFTNLVLEIIRRVDFWLVLLLFGKTSAGLYLVALSWMQLSTPFFDTYSGALFPQISRGSSDTFHSEFVLVLKRILLRVSIAVTTLVLVLWFLGIKVLPLFLSPEYSKIISFLFLIVPLVSARTVVTQLVEIYKALNLQYVLVLTAVILLSFSTVSIYFLAPQSLKVIISFLGVTYILLAFVLATFLHFPKVTKLPITP